MSSKKDDILIYSLWLGIFRNSCHEVKSCLRCTLSHLQCRLVVVERGRPVPGLVCGVRSGPGSRTSLAAGSLATEQGWECRCCWPDRHTQHNSHLSRLLPSRSTTSASYFDTLTIYIDTQIYVLLILGWLILLDAVNPQVHHHTNAMSWVHSVFWSKARKVTDSFRGNMYSVTNWSWYCGESKAHKLSALNVSIWQQENLRCWWWTVEPTWGICNQMSS